MKLAGARAAAFCTGPDPEIAGALLYGPDAGLIALRRRQLVAAITEGDALRLAQLDPGAALKDPAAIDAELRARGFFPGRRVVLIDGARDNLAVPLEAILADIGPGASSRSADPDAFLLVTATGLTARSQLRRLFDGARALVSLGLYPDAPDERELSAMLDTAGLSSGLPAHRGSGAGAGRLSSDALQELAFVAARIDRGELVQLIEKIAIFSLDREGLVGSADLAPLMPTAVDSELDQLVAAVADGRAEAVGPLIDRLAGAGIEMTTVLIATARHFRELLRLVIAHDGIDAAISRVRPPVYGARRQTLAARARHWGPRRLETANRLLFEADRNLRSPGDRPDHALVERCLIRLAMMAARG